MKKNHEHNYYFNRISGGLRIDLAPGEHVALACTHRADRADTVHHPANTDDTVDYRYCACSVFPADTLVIN